MHRHVGEADLEHVDVEDPAEGARSDADVVADPEGMGEEEHQAREDVSEALLGGDAQHDPGHAGTHEQVVDRHPEHAEDGEEDDDVADAGGEEAHGGPGARYRPQRDEPAETLGELARGDDARDEEHGRADPADHLCAHRRVVELAELGADDEGGGGDHRGGDAHDPVVLALPRHLVGCPVFTISPG